MLAAYYDEEEITRRLLKAGVDPALTTTDELTALDFATGTGNEVIVKNILKAMRKIIKCVQDCTWG